MTLLELPGERSWRSARPPSAPGRGRSARRRACRSSRWSSPAAVMPSAVEGVAHDQRGLAHPGERRAGTGIEIEVQMVGPVGVVAARVPRVEVDAAQVHDPEERGEVLHHGKGDQVGRLVHRSRRSRASPDAADGRALHEEALPVDAVGIALHHHRAVAEVRQQGGRHVGVVLQQVALGVARLGPERPCRGW